MKIIFALVAGAIAAGALFFFLRVPHAPVFEKEALPRVSGFAMNGIADFEIAEYFSAGEDAREEHFFAQRGGDILRVMVIQDASRERTEKSAAGQFLLLEGQYDSRLPPYPEFLTNQTGCASGFLPKKRAAPEGAYYL